MDELQIKANEIRRLHALARERNRHLEQLEANYNQLKTAAQWVVAKWNKGEYPISHDYALGELDRILREQEK